MAADEHLTICCSCKTPGPAPPTSPILGSGSGSKKCRRLRKSSEEIIIAKAPPPLDADETYFCPSPVLDGELSSQDFLNSCEYFLKFFCKCTFGQDYMFFKCIT
jgi:hypothetical protein